jgi:cytochrome b561
MTLFGTEIRYGTVAQAFHWVTAALVASAWLVAGERGGLLSLHETLGFTIFVIVAARLLWRAVDRRPSHEALPTAVAFSSQIVHWLLYGLLLAIPLSAIVGSWLEGHSITVYGLGAIGPYLSQSRYLGHQIFEVHQTLGDAIVWLAGLHAAAALFHHFFVRDGVLRAMLPGGRAA